MTQEVEHLQGQAKRAGALQPGKEKFLGRSESVLSVSKRGCKKEETHSLAGSIVMGQGEMVSK